ncbi:hypothetical protein WJX82_005111 [Trebouxia sp. C0006]
MALSQARVLALPYARVFELVPPHLSAKNGEQRVRANRRLLSRRYQLLRQHWQCRQTVSRQCWGLDGDQSDKRHKYGRSGARWQVNVAAESYGRQAPSVSPKVLDVHVLVNAKEDLKMRSEYDIPAGVVRFRDFEKSFGVKVLEYAVSTSDAAPGTEDYKAAVGKKALPSNSTSLWLKAKREGDQPWFLKLLKPDFSTRTGKGKAKANAKKRPINAGDDGAIAIEECRTLQIKLKTALAENHHLSQQCHNSDLLIHNVLDLHSQALACGGGKDATPATYLQVAASGFRKRPHMEVGRSSPARPANKKSNVKSGFLGKAELKWLGNSIRYYHLTEKGHRSSECAKKTSGVPASAAHVFLDFSSSHTLTSASYARRMGFTVTPNHNPLQGATVFSSLELTSGYHQIRPEDVPKTAFNTPFGQYKFKMLVGLVLVLLCFRRVVPLRFCQSQALACGDGKDVMPSSYKSEHGVHLNRIQHT